MLWWNEKKYSWSPEDVPTPLPPTSLSPLPRFPCLRGDARYPWRRFRNREWLWREMRRNASVCTGEHLAGKLKFKCCEGPWGDTTADGYFCFLPYSFLWQSQSCLQEKLHTCQKPQLSGMTLAESIPKPSHPPITTAFTSPPPPSCSTHMGLLKTDSRFPSPIYNPAALG